MVLDERLAVKLTLSDNKGIDQLLRGEHPDLRPGHIWWANVLQKLGKKTRTELLPIVECLECGKSFKKTRVNKVTCSAYCSALRRNRNYKRWIKENK